MAIFFKVTFVTFKSLNEKNPERMKRTVNVRAHVWSALDLSPKK